MVGTESRSAGNAERSFQGCKTEGETPSKTQQQGKMGCNGATGCVSRKDLVLGHVENFPNSALTHSMITKWAEDCMESPCRCRLRQLLLQSKDKPAHLPRVTAHSTWQWQRLRLSVQGPDTSRDSKLLLHKAGVQPKQGFPGRRKTQQNPRGCWKNTIETVPVSDFKISSITVHCRYRFYPSLYIKNSKIEKGCGGSSL